MSKFDELRLIESFIKAAETGSFTQAAQALAITPAAISKNISNLEKSLGVKLFNRTTRSLNLTSEGSEFVLQAKQVLHLLEQATEAVRHHSNEPQGKVRISTPNEIGRLFIIPLLGKLKEKYPKVVIDLDLNDRNVDLVKDGFDLVIRGGIIENSSLVARKVGSISLRLVASTQYLKRNSPPQTSQALEQHSLIVRTKQNGKPWAWRFLQDESVIYSINLEHASFSLTDVEGMLNLVLQGQGIAQLPYYLVHEHLRQGTLVSLLEDEHISEDFDLVIQYPHRQFIAARVKQVIEFFVEELRQNKGLNFN
ncbi:LysR family transcriptional regulator [Psittacicella gerlachiana]|uniref:HTH lysR-type domain-containing protein n=1 Tax=Psittacicella gerlachiana TaxID=2028574 RepID=A0A3A1YG36_9GAMM|nr:LysR family transcriptional regulator [Psittacicella gerlachiana]RIY36050.1 hypothetical protein CKF59_02995 [Psittacicella gerlachiana]